MDITKEIISELKRKNVSKALKNIPEIQIFANHEHFLYQWRDTRFEEHSDTYENPQFKTRAGMKEAIEKHLREMGDL